MHLIQILLPLNDGQGRRFPAESFERLAHELTERFGGVSIREESVFIVTCESESIVAARKVLLTTGLKDDVPNIEGIEKFYGRSPPVSLLRWLRE